MTELARRTGVIVGLWTLYGVLMALQSHHRLTLANRPVSWGYVLSSEMGFGYLWAAITPAILWLGNRFPIRKEMWWKSGLLHLSAALVCGAITKGAWDFLVLPFWMPAKVPKNPVETWRSISVMLDYGMLQYALVLVCQQAWDYHRRYEEGRLRASQLEAQLASAQLQALKMQLHPHFLFNTLHAISELVHEDPVAAERVIARLSDFLRLTLEQSGVLEVSLEQELDFLKRYLEIEKIRFEDRLHVEFHVDPEALQARVPNFILQPLVENALRHGLADCTEKGFLRVQCSRGRGGLAMRVFDNGPGLKSVPLAARREGVGLANTRERLQRLYGEEHVLVLRNVPTGGFEVTIQIPYRPMKE